MLIKRNISIDDIQKCISGNSWSFGNDVLYEMCKKNPQHINAEVIVGKLWIIGRTYAAAIERRKNANEVDAGDDFYFNVVAPKMLFIGEELDKRIQKLRQYDIISKHNLIEIIDTHLYLTNIFSDISGLNKRSLASKYLHFHVPKMFYIYDSRAIQGAKSYIMPDKALMEYLAPFGDKDYIELVARLFTFQEYVQSQFGISIKPRAIDSFLLDY